MHRRLLFCCAALFVISAQGCTSDRASFPAGQPYATVVAPVDPVRVAPSKHAPVVGYVFGGMHFTVTGRAENCQFLQVQTPWWEDRVWIVGPPEFAVLHGAGCSRSLSTATG